MFKQNNCTALMELVICLLPYLLVMMGAVFFWHLEIGKQEAIKYASTAAGINDEQQSVFKNTTLSKIGNLEGVFVVSDVVEYSASMDGSFNEYVNITDNDEPVLPYKSDGSDISRAIDLSGNAVVYNPNTGEYTVNQNGKSGRRLQAIDAVDSSDNGKTLNPDADNSTTQTNSAPSREASLLLGEWLSYQSAGAGYSYAIPFGRNALPFEENFTKSKYAWRSADGVKSYSENEINKQRAIWASISDPDMRDWENAESEQIFSLSNIMGIKFDDLPAQELSFDSLSIEYTGLNYSVMDKTLQSAE